MTSAYCLVIMIITTILQLIVSFTYTSITTSTIPKINQNSCDSCMYTIGMYEEQILSTKNISKIQNEVYYICNELSTEIETATCKNIVAELVIDFGQLTKHIIPYYICDKLNLCGDNSHVGDHMNLNNNLLYQNNLLYCNEFKETFKRKLTLSTKPIPKYIDWREHGVVSPVKNQYKCGSCYAFAATEAIESAYAIKHKVKAPILSPQNIIDCDDNDLGCSGGLPNHVFKYVKENGICLENDYPYKSKENISCNNSNCTKKIYIKECQSVEPLNTYQMLRAVAQQPIVVGVESDNPIFHLYKSGIIDSPLCGTNIDHFVVIVGYSISDNSSQSYWIVRNSWGTEYGENGYVRIAIDSDNLNKNTQGVCGINITPMIPVIA